MDSKNRSRNQRRVETESRIESRTDEQFDYETVLARLIDKAPVVIACFDREGRCEFMNEGAKATTGRSFDYYVGKSVASFTVHPAEMLKECERRINGVLESGQRDDWEFSIPRSTGLKHFVSAFFPEVGADGTTQRVVLLAMDISNHRSTGESLRESDLRKDTFFAMLAHELRNPLATLRSGLKILEMAPDGEQQERVRIMMDRQLSHVIRLVNDILDVSRVARGQLTLVTTKILLSDVITLALETSAHSIQKGCHTLSVSLPEGPVEIMGDLNRLAQVLSNLLDNASKYTPSGGAISLRVACTKSTAEIRIADNGYGIPQEQFERVFRAFSQVEAAIPRSRGGLGIGLFLVKILVEAHNGEIRIESPISKEGEGTAFTVAIPLAIP